MSAIRPHSKRERRRSSMSAQLFGRTVAGDDDLLHALVQRVEGVEELFLRALLAGEELDVVDEQHVDVAELVAEAGHLVVADRVDHLVGELFAGDVADGGMGLAALHVVADGVHEVGLAHARRRRRGRAGCRPSTGARRLPARRPWRTGCRCR